MAGQLRVVTGMLGDEHRIRSQYREPVVHLFGVGGVLPVRKEPCGVGEGQPAFDLVDLEREGDSLRGQASRAADTMEARPPGPYIMFSDRRPW